MRDASCDFATLRPNSRSLRCYSSRPKAPLTGADLRRGGRRASTPGDRRRLRPRKRPGRRACAVRRRRAIGPTLAARGAARPAWRTKPRHRQRPQGLRENRGIRPGQRPKGVSAEGRGRGPHLRPAARRDDRERLRRDMGRGRHGADRPARPRLRARFALAMAVGNRARPPRLLAARAGARRPRRPAQKLGGRRRARKTVPAARVLQRPVSCRC